MSRIILCVCVDNLDRMNYENYTTPQINHQLYKPISDLASNDFGLNGLVEAVALGACAVNYVYLDKYRHQK